MASTAPDCDENSERASGAGEQNAFGEKLTDDARATRAEREANGHLFLPRCGTRERESGDIGAGDQQHETDHDHDKKQHGCDLGWFLRRGPIARDEE